jgi:hypothetical protein
LPARNAILGLERFFELDEAEGRAARRDTDDVEIFVRQEADAAG